jgi:hypothetical protein
MEYSEFEGVENAPLTSVFCVRSTSIGGFGRVAQSAWLLEACTV